MTKLTLAMIAVALIATLLSMGTILPPLIPQSLFALALCTALLGVVTRSDAQRL